MKEKYKVLICGGTGCTSSNSNEIKEVLIKELEENNLSEDVKVVQTGCFGLCALGPVMIVYPGGIFYSKMDKNYIPEIVREHFINGNVVKKYVYKETLKKDGVGSLQETNFFRKQTRIALRNCGVIDPENIDDYLEHDGYKAIQKTLKEYTPDETIKIVLDSGLRGRGGGGFPTGRKWQLSKASVNDTKFVICNADEGDPGAFMDRSVLEGDPHSVLEAMAICGYAIGSHQGYIYIRAEYPLAVHRLEVAIKQARERGYLGKNLFGSGFDFDIDLRLGAGAFVCGEETALMASIEGERGMPRIKPPFPAVKGLWGYPTNVNNVETLANVPVIILKGAEEFKKVGTEKSSGTKVFALGGKINNTGLVEVPMGTTLKEVIYDIGGGIPNKREFKAAQTGGPSGGCITKENLDTPIDFDNLTAIGSMMGSGGMIIMDEDNCMVDIAKFYLEFTVDESCGKCTPCREGTRKMLDILEKISEGEGTLEDLDQLEKLANMIKDTSLCGLGQSAPNPVLSTLKHFRKEYEAHVINKVCPAGVCKNLSTYIITDACIGCTKCATHCPVGAISGSLKQKHSIDLNKCVKCGTCKKNCPVRAITSNPEGLPC